MSRPGTLTEFLEFTGFRPRFFDMGRRVQTIHRGQFLEIERGDLPYPFPLQRQAWIAILLQEPGTATDPAVWFLRFPLDEQGKLLLAARDDFMQQLLARTEKNLGSMARGDRVHSALDGNSYSFKPNQERLAVFHAKASRLLKRPATAHYGEALAYFRGELGWDQWSRLPLQGIADLAVRAAEDPAMGVVAKAIPNLPAEPYSALCHCLENEETTAEVAAALAARVAALLEQPAPDGALIAASVRGLSRSRAEKTTRMLIEQVLEHPVSRDIGILAAIGGRAWESLAHPQTRRLFLERLAVNSGGPEQFDHCLTDLLFMPGLRRPLLAAMGDPSRSGALEAAVGRFFDALGTR